MPKKTPKAKPLHLDDLKKGFQHIPKDHGGTMAMAAAVCLENQHHHSGVELGVSGAFASVYEVRWASVRESHRRYWNDLEEATREGAYAVSILTIRDLTGYTIVERALKRTGIDWWLGTEDDLFQKKARLEVSGILRGDSSRVAARVRMKEKQSQQSDASRLDVYVSVVEFSTPLAHVVKR